MEVLSLPLSYFKHLDSGTGKAVSRQVLVRAPLAVGLWCGRLLS